MIEETIKIKIEIMTDKPQPYKSKICRKPCAKMKKI